MKKIMNIYPLKDNLVVISDIPMHSQSCAYKCMPSYTQTFYKRKTYFLF